MTLSMVLPPLKVLLNDPAEVPAPTATVMLVLFKYTGAATALVTASDPRMATAKSLLDIIVRTPR